MRSSGAAPALKRQHLLGLHRPAEFAAQHHRPLRQLAVLEQRCRRLAEHGVGTVARHALGAAVEQRDATVAVDQHHRDLVGGVEHALQLRRVAALGGLGRQLLGDVAGQREIAGEAALRIMQGAEGVRDLQPLAVADAHIGPEPGVAAVQAGGLAREDLVVAYRPPELGREPRRGVADLALEVEAPRRCADHLGRRAAQHALGGAVEDLDIALRIDDDDGDAFGAVEHRLQPLRGAAQRFLGGTFCTQAHGHAEMAAQRALAVAQLADRQRHRQARTVAADVAPDPARGRTAVGAQREHLAHRHRATELGRQLGGALRQFFGIVEAPWRAAHHLLRAVAEHQLGATIEVGDAILEVGGDDRDLAGRVEYRLQVVMGLGQVLPQCAQRGDLAAGAAVAQESAAIVEHRVTRHAQPDQCLARPLHRVLKITKRLMAFQLRPVRRPDRLARQPGDQMPLFPASQTKVVAQLLGQRRAGVCALNIAELQLRVLLPIPVAGRGQQRLDARACRLGFSLADASGGDLGLQRLTALDQLQTASRQHRAQPHQQQRDGHAGTQPAALPPGRDPGITRSTDQHPGGAGQLQVLAHMAILGQSPGTPDGRAELTVTAALQQRERDRSFLKPCRLHEAIEIGHRRQRTPVALPALAVADEHRAALHHAEPTLHQLHGREDQRRPELPRTLNLRPLRRHVAIVQAQRALVALQRMDEGDDVIGRRHDVAQRTGCASHQRHRGVEAALVQMPLHLQQAFQHLGAVEGRGGDRIQPGAGRRQGLAHLGLRACQCLRLLQPRQTDETDRADQADQGPGPEAPPGEPEPRAGHQSARSTTLSCRVRPSRQTVRRTVSPF